jgi:hypothetical protein
MEKFLLQHTGQRPVTFTGEVIASHHNESQKVTVYRTRGGHYVLHNLVRGRVLPGAGGLVPDEERVYHTETFEGLLNYLGVEFPAYVRVPLLQQLQLHQDVARTIE